MRYPPDVIERRYWRGLYNFFELYSGIVNAWTLCDNSGTAFVIIAQKNENDVVTVYDQSRFDEIKRAAQRKD